MALTPMMQQYLQIKEENPQCILFFRLGDFYEMFFEDAKIASRELELVLTGRDCGLEERAPMCGIPYHAANVYISKLVSRGYKVGICEQLEDPSVAKGIVKRGIVKVYTPGTYIEGNFLEDRKNNYIMSIYFSVDKFYIAFSDISTGEFSSSYFNYDVPMLLSEISKYNPSEIIIHEEIKEEVIAAIKERFSVTFTNENLDFYMSGYKENVESYFKDYNIDEKPIGLAYSINSIIRYIKETQKADLSHINTLNIYEIEDFLSIDINTRKNLELTETQRDKTKKGSLLWVLDKTSTAMGARELRKWIDQPLINKNAIELRLEAVAELVSNLSLQEELKVLLKDIYDIERLVGKVSSKSVNAKELLSIKSSISKIPAIKTLLKQCTSSYLQEIYNNLDELSDIEELLEKSIDESPAITLKEGNLIKEGYNSEIDQLKVAKKDGKLWLSELEAREKETTGIKSLKVSFNKVFGYYIEVTKTNLNMVPEHRYIRKQTLANCERYITDELKKMEDIILGAEEKLISLEYDVFVEVRELVLKEVLRMQQSARLIATIDCLNSLAIVALENNYTRPAIDVSGIINIKEGRHPVVEKLLPTGNFISNSISLDREENQLLIITGPNMGGKSTYMRQCALITIMAQIGSFVPAESATIGICDKVFTRIGASDDLAGGKSTFMVEMWEVANILNNATNNSLVLLDEVGRGTSTYDGLSIAWAVIEFLTTNKNVKCKTLFATHYHELTKLEAEFSGVKNYSVGVKKIGEEIIFLHKIVKGAADESYGIEVARLAGLPQAVLDRSKEILMKLEEENLEEKDITKRTSEVKLVEAAVVIEKVEKNIEVIETPNVEIEKLPAKEVAKKQEKPVQMDFYEITRRSFVDEISRLDLMNMTPLDAMTKLNELIKKSKDLL